MPASSLCHARYFQSSSVMPDIFNYPLSFPTCSIPSVIPDIFNRESMAFPMKGHTNKGTEEKAPGFPLKTGGNDRGGPAGMTRGPTGMKGARAGPSVMPDVFNPLPSCPMCSILSVIPDIFNRESMAFPMQGHTNKRTEEKDAGFPLTTGGNDRRGPAGMTKGSERV